MERNMLLKIRMLVYVLLFCLFPFQGYADQGPSIDCSAASYTLPQGQWHLISLPCNLGDNNSVGAVVADDMPGTIGTDWTIYEYDTQSLSYRELTEEDVLTQGRGYWVIQVSDNEIIINLEGSADTGMGTIPLATRPGKYQWNMIGLPLSEERPLSESKIITQTGQCTSGCSLGEAMDKKIVDKIWRYNPVSEEYDVVPSTENASPWSGYFIATLSTADGTNPSLIFPVNLDKLLQDTKNLLNSGGPNTTPEKFSQMEFGKNLRTESELESSEKAHRLVASAEDPDPEWFSTEVDSPIIVARSGGNYTAHLNKSRQDGSTIGPVDNDKLRLVVRIQREKERFEKISENDIPLYAQWNGAGILDIHVPDDLGQGRLLVGVRPNFSDEATNAIAERWSTVISAEVWPLKPNVTTLDSAAVVFPVDTPSGFTPDTQFSREELGEKVKQQLTQHNALTLPLVVKGTDFQAGDLVAYIFLGKPYAGKVLTAIAKQGQQFILLTPEYPAVYEITGLSENAVKDNGLYPEHVIYREGDVAPSEANGTVGGDVAERSASARRRGSDLWDIDCEWGKSGISFEPSFTLYPFDFGFNISAYVISDAAKCSITAKPRPFVTFRPSIVTGGPVAAAVSLIFGTSGTITPYGGEILEAKGLPGIGFEMGWAFKDKGYIRRASPTVGTLGSRDISRPENAYKGSLDLSASLGVQFELDATSPEGALGWTYNKIFSGEEIEKFSIKIKVGPQIAYAAESLNAREVYKRNTSSSFALKAGISASVEIPQPVIQLLEYYGVKQEPIIVTPYNVEGMKADLEFTFDKVIDDGKGKADLNGFKLKHFSPLFSKASGVLAPIDENSSVFNDKSESIDYELSECQENTDYKISSPVIGCTDWMCGKADKAAKLCTGSLKEISSHFDTGLEGWIGTGGTVSFSSSGGGLDGHLEQHDSEGDDMTVYAPVKFMGDLSEFVGGLISFDGKNIGGSRPDLYSHPYYGTVTITGGGTSAELEYSGPGSPANDSVWHHYSEPLDPELWRGDLVDALSNVSEIKIVLEFTYGIVEIAGFDNFRIKTTSE
jgi:hypothetical protein